MVTLNTIKKETEFFTYLLEHYAEYKGMLGSEVLARWDELGITERVYAMYPIYHVERLQNAFDDIEAMAAEAVSRREG